jgi:hypothetical protein
MEIQSQVLLPPKIGDPYNKNVVFKEKVYLSEEPCAL